MERMLNQVKKFLQKEYKSVTGNSVTITKLGEPKILVQSTSRVRTFVQAYQHYKISGIKADTPYEPGVRDVTRKFLEQHSTKKPRNVTRKKD